MSGTNTRGQKEMLQVAREGMAYLARLFSQLGLIAAAGSHFPCN